MSDPISESDFITALQRGHGPLTEYIRGHIPRFHRIASGLLTSPVRLQGPTVDVGSIEAELYPFLKHYLAQTLPYQMTALGGHGKVCDGDRISCSAFNCERDVLPMEAASAGLILFCDVLEHLLVDPMAAALEFNRVLRKGGHLVINTPNANSADRITRILKGSQVATESFYKPTGLYDRHNREWNIAEVIQFLELSGFAPRKLDTHSELLREEDRKILEWAHANGIIEGSDSIYGPEIFCVAEKIKDIVEPQMSIDERWPAWLYTGIDTYRKRPARFPVLS